MKADLSKWILFLSLHDMMFLVIIDIRDKYDLMSCLSCCLVSSSMKVPKQVCRSDLCNFLNIYQLSDLSA